MAFKKTDPKAKSKPKASKGLADDAGESSTTLNPGDSAKAAAPASPAAAAPRDGAPVPVGTRRLPIIGDMPIGRQLFVLGALTVLFAAFGLVFVFLDLSQASSQASYAEITGDSLMHSQRLAKAVPEALVGNEQAFEQLADSRDRMNENLRTLTDGGELNGKRVPRSSARIQPILERVEEQWSRTDKQAGIVLDNKQVLTNIGQTLRALNDSNPTLLELTEQIAALKLQASAPAREISASSQLVMLTQRLAKNANELLSGEGVNPETAFLLGKDTNTFRDLLEGLTNGSDALHISPARDPETRERLTELQKQFTAFQQQIGALLGNLQKIVASKQAEQQVFKENEDLRKSVLELQQGYGEEQRARRINTWAMILCGAMALAFLGAMAVAALGNTGAQASEAERRRAEAQRQEEEAKRQNDANQAAILRLMNELQEVADGDLTTQATVSEDITGAIADSVNYTVEELRTLVGRINTTAELVTSASTQAQETSNRLLAASEAQSREIRNTGESVLKMAQQINDVSSSAMESANVARQSLAAAEEGQRAVQNSIAGMNEIRDQIQETSKRIKRLGESSQEIGEIIELISDITEQTNVLALNAAIQAASAGEAGRGFSVVAEEVQRLAERSAEATKQIGALVRTIQTDTQDAVAAMEKSTQGVVEGAKLSDAAGQALANIGSVSRQLAELIEKISQDTSVQARSAGGVAQSIQHILTVNEETSQGTQKTADSISQLSALAQELKSSVARFKVA
jgi:twitching motility protein PilJ